MDNLLFENLDINNTNSIIKITLRDDLQRKWDEIFDEEYKKVSLRDRPIKTDKRILKKRALESIRQQLSLSNETKDFHLSNKEFFISKTKNPIVDGKITLQKELMCLEELDVNNLEEAFNDNLLKIMRTGAYCFIIGG